ncbi:MAG: arsenic resistance N-acetyltransferase ArsN2 [Gemmatimonadota bacterium]|nr:arsenic resistance N-acetyltransferase ArsN2 [Gemmatimonadota bacterium]
MLRVGLLRVREQRESTGEGKVRPGSSRELGAVKRLLAANKLPVDGVPDSLQNFLVAFDGQKVIGAIGLEVFEDSALLRSAVVDEAARGTGLGAQLVEGALAKARVLRLRDVFLLTTTAEKYFPRFGFAPVPRETAPQDMQQSAEFTGACPASAVLMKLTR